jgi:hypothetical protein
MATLNEFAYNIRNIARAGLGNSDDERLSISMIKFWIRGYRAKAIFELTAAGKQVDPQLVQDMGILTLSEVDKSDSECPKVEWGCSIKKVTIPKLVDWPDNRAIIFIGLIDKQTPIILDHSDTHIFKRATRFGKLMHRAYLIGNTFYVVTKDNESELKYINVRGVFENPTEVSKYPNPGCEEVCFNEDTDEYPIPMRLYEAITRNILINELQMTLQTVNDELNNARQDNQKLG